YRGLVKRRLIPIVFSGPAPDAGTPILADGREVGEVRSTADGRGLANLRLDAISGAQLTADDEPVAVARPEWLKPDT
ncbi:MAG: folate-binding protein, partial [Alphaproteobacteria bacterium]|nr:folate-binding protein [Alphaproteobacteria bacterium]